MMLGAVVVGMTAVGVTSYQNRLHKIAVSEAATSPSATVGPPCPVLTKAEFDALAVKPEKTFIFNEVTFVRRFGHVECNVISHGGGTGFAPLCRFNAPAVLKVTTRQGEFYFKTGVGRPVTVSTPDGIPKCVVAGRP